MNDEHPTTKSDSQPYNQPYEEPKKENLSGSLTTDEVTIIGNTPVKTKRKPRMRDLSKMPNEDIQELVRRKEARERRNQRVNNEYNKRFSMFSSPTKAFLYLGGSAILTVIMIHCINVILASAGYPTAIPI